MKIDEDTVFTGSSDGMIRIVSILPNKLLGVVGEHSDCPIERLTLSPDRRLVLLDAGFIHNSHNSQLNRIKFNLFIQFMHNSHNSQLNRIKFNLFIQFMHNSHNSQLNRITFNLFIQFIHSIYA